MTTDSDSNLPLPSGVGIGDDHVTASAPLVRALVVQRLELMWRTCEPFITTEHGKPDPRYIEAGIRITDRLTKLYRLDQGAPGTSEPGGETTVDDRTLLEGKVAELEARIKGSQAT